jgi:hypothetical protein
VPEEYPSRSPETAWRVYDGQAVILRPDDSTLNTLNAVGTLIWQAADGQTSLSAMVARICEAFEIEPARAETDARAFIDKLCRRGLLTVGQSQREGP